MQHSVQGFDFTTLGALLFVASLVAIATHRLKLPYSVGLVTAGIALALLPLGIALPLTPELIFFVFLPPLVFEAAIQIPWKPLRSEMPLLLALVTVGVVLAALVVAAGMHWIVGWSWLGAGFFGVLIAATDPVSVIAAFKAMRVQTRLHLLVEAESLLNDGVAAVGFAILAMIAAGGAAGPGNIAIHLVTNVVGAIAAGAAVAVPLIVIAGRTTDRLVEVTLTMLIAYGSFLLAEHFHCSGVLATLTAGLIVGNYGFLGSISDSGRQGVLNHWEYVAFLINSLIFILIGGREVSMPIAAVIEVAAIATILSLAGRAVAVYPVMMLFRHTKLAVPWKYKHVLFWGGLRGALALALALALPANVFERDTIITVAFAVVAFSIFVQGLTMPWLIDRLKLRRDQEAEPLHAAVPPEQ
ncbi:cation:proton antiporter [Stakelama sediminis]|uniref:CPA1 family monovalent cation:H+ antiporter n=1 Tax=Stakelama sediminis TaxID=463200 RepID=A0A840Z047_9SPHN|nr:cation:proton antiporter [Stakelama sediminis]MBB5719106.1 CPA1 family monovalent cation:H+ antiporter [Stakelama sediminis]